MGSQVACIIRNLQQLARMPLTTASLAGSNEPYRQQLHTLLSAATANPTGSVS